MICALYFFRQKIQNAVIKIQIMGNWHPAIRDGTFMVNLGR